MFVISTSDHPNTAPALGEVSACERFRWETYKILESDKRRVWEEGEEGPGFCLCSCRRKKSFIFPCLTEVSKVK